MFSQPISSPLSGPQGSTATTTITSTTTSTRPSRLRGLSYLRNYTHNHLLSRDSSHQSNNNSSNTSTGGRANGNTSPIRRPSNHLTRSVSYTPVSTTAAASSSASANEGLTLVSSNPDPSSKPPTTATRSATTGNLLSVPSISETPNSTILSNELATPAGQSDSTMTRTRSSTMGATTKASEAVPSIRFSAYFDPRSTRPSLTFSPITRSYPSGSMAIRVGRYSERDSQSAANGNSQSAAPVGFKSKVVSRKHCEFWCEDGKWYVRDVKSSSGTFLNHIRLSPPSQDSKAFPINDGDIIQLGIDFKGGEEMIFRCVKMRVELNRGWQNKLNTFNMSVHKRLRTMANTGPAPSNASASSHDCSICLNSIGPCQSLFVAPCFHQWHFKCVRSLLTSPQYPIFICPNCRAGADLEADVDEQEPMDDWELEPAANEAPKPTTNDQTLSRPPRTSDGVDESLLNDADVMDVTVAIDTLDSPGPRPGGIPYSATEPLPITNPASGSGRLGGNRDNRTPSPTGGAEGPITPRNDAGPWVFDGSAGRPSQDGGHGMRNLNAAVDGDVNMDRNGHHDSDASSS